MRRQQSKFIRSGNERQAGKFGDFRCGAFGESGGSIQARADRGAAEGQFIEFRITFFDPSDRRFQLDGIPGKFLSEGQRDRILQMGAADFHDVLELLRFGRDQFFQRVKFGKQTAAGLEHGSNVHGCREGVVRGLRHVDVIVGMDRFFGAAFAAEKF